MRTLEVKLFGINELAEEVKAQVIERYRNKEEFCWDWTDSEFLTDWFQDYIVGTMFEDCKVHWSLSNCQGDGVMLIGRVDEEKLYDVAIQSGNFTNHQLRRIKFLLDHTKYEMVYNRYYNSFFNTVDVTDYLPCSYAYSKKHLNELYELMDSLESLVKLHADMISSELEFSGYSTIENQYTDEFIVDRLESWGIEFTEDGRDF